MIRNTSMKKILLTAALGLLTAAVTAGEAVKVTYAAPGQGGRQGGRMSAFRTVLTIDGDQCRISREIDTAMMLKQNPEWAARLKEIRPRGGEQRRGVSETQYIDYGTHKYYSVAGMPDGTVIATEEPFVLDSALTIEPSDTVICGYKCKVATTVIKSNTIKYWFTDEAGMQGTIQPAADLPKGLVLMTSRNGRIGLKAQSIEKINVPDGPMIPTFTTLVDAPMYRYRINNAGVITVPVFDNEYIGITAGNAPGTIDSLQSDTVYRLSGGTVILRKVKLPETSKGWDIFAQVVQKADKDAYDRIGSVFVIPTGKEKSFLDALVNGLNTVPAFESRNGKQYPGIIATGTYDTPVELLRFATPFGVGGYNSYQVPGQVWADSVIYHQDVTHLAPLLEGEVWIGAYIGNWTEKAHKLSLTLKYHPGGGQKGNRIVIPAFNSLNLMEQGGQDYPSFMGDDSLRVTVNVPQNLKGAQLVYLTTGHGGWGGGDEFNQKENTVYLDGQKIFNFIPWRGDCASYRRRNPASGNFSNGLSSSDLSRSNWCPGMVTNPVYIPLGDLPKGVHSFAITIPQGKPEGSSFSYWCLSGAIVGDQVDKLPAGEGRSALSDVKTQKDKHAKKATKARKSKKR